MLMLPISVPMGAASCRKTVPSEVPSVGATSIAVQPALARFVDALWVLEGSAREGTLGTSLDMLPSPHAVLCVAYGPSCEHLGAQAASAVCGIYSSTRSYVLRESIGVVMIHFKPGGLRAFTPLTCGEFAETSVRAWDLWSSELALLEERVAELPNALARAAAVQEFLVAKLDPSRCDVLAARVASAILEAGGRVSVSALADDASMSERQLERRFVHGIGAPPKRFARIARFARALAIAKHARSWSEVALDAGYADQSHLVREFVAFTGRSPERLVGFPSISMKTSADLSGTFKRTG